MRFKRKLNFFLQYEILRSHKIDTPGEREEKQGTSWF